LEQLADGVLMDEERLSIVAERLSLIYSLQKKHRVDTVAALLTLQQEFEHKLLDSDQQEEQIDNLKKEIEALRHNLINSAKQITANRMDVKGRSETEVQSAQ